jgi:hypothetical protein
VILTSLNYHLPMFSPSGDDPAGLSIAGRGQGRQSDRSGTAAVVGEQECLRLLRSLTEGSLTYCDGRGVVTLAVTYDVVGHGVVVCVAEFNPAVQYVPGRDVTLVVTGYLGLGSRWVVRLTGSGRRLPSTASNLARHRRQLTQWPPGVPATMLRIPGTRIRGFVEIGQDQLTA